MIEKLDELIDEALRTEPTFKLKPDFKDKLVQLIRRKERMEQRRVYFFIMLGTLAIVGAGVGAIFFFADLEVFSGLGQLAPMAVLVGAIVVLIQYLDKKLVKDKLLKQLT